MPFNAACHLGGFHPSPTVVLLYAFTQMLLVHLSLNLFPITADFARYADSDFVLLQKPGYFGYQGDEFQACADILLVLA